MNTKPYQVMLVDDSAVIRGLFSRWLEQDDNIKVAAYAANGIQALKELERHDLDVIILDTEMPEMDGMQALPQILQARPKIKVLMACTQSHQDAEISLKAMQAGASDYVMKPGSNKDLHTDLAFRRDMIEKIKALAAAARRQTSPHSRLEVLSSRKPDIISSAARANHHPFPRADHSSIATDNESGSGRLYANQSIVLRAQSKSRPEILAIGSSTGGPQALLTLFKSLKGHLHVPAVITQHMPANFTSILSEHLSRITDGICKEGEDGEELHAGNVYLAPGDHHMLIQRRGSRMMIRTNQDPPENFCRPAVDPMMRSLKNAYGDRVLAVILTGMGQDGLKGCRELVEAGSTLLAQDESTSVVWGMPGAVATNGLCSALLPIDKIGPTIIKLLEGGHL